MNERTRFLAETAVGRLLIRLSLPAMVGMFVQASYNLVDAFFIGHGVGPLGLAATAVAFPFQLMTLAIATTGGVGAASLISRSLGAGDIERADRTLGTLITTATVFGILGALFVWLKLDPLLRLLGATEETFPYARAYVSIILIGVPLQVFGVGLNNAVRAEGNARIAMISMFVSALTNIVLDPLFIFTFKMGIAGAAWATVIAKGAVVVWLGLYYLTGRSALTLRPAHLLPRRDIIAEMLAVGSSEFARLSANSLIVALVVRSVSFYGSDLAVAAYGVISRTLSLAFMPTFGIAQGMQPILGYNYGARLYGRTHRVIALSVTLATIWSSLAWILTQLFPGPIFGLFTPDPALRELGSRALHLVTLGFCCVGFQIIGAALFQALGKARPAFFLSLSRQVLLFIPLLYLLPPLLGLKGVWLAFPGADLLSALVTLFFFRRQMRQLKTAERSSGP
ncbi:MAG: MATE family efflux transporter [Synergistales bacterium]|nr:MATE family efflux transporter [Synergistales bacterium]